MAAKVDEVKSIAGILILKNLSEATILKIVFSFAFLLSSCVNLRAASGGDSLLFKLYKKYNEEKTLGRKKEFFRAIRRASQDDLKSDGPILLNLALGKNISVCQALVGRGVDVNCLDKIGYPPLFWAINSKRGHKHGGESKTPEDIDFLCNKGALVILNKHNFLLLAASHGDVKTFERLFECGNENSVDVRAKNSVGETLLHCAARNSCGRCAYKIVLLLAKNNGMYKLINEKDKKGKTPFLVALENGNKKAALCLLEQYGNAIQVDTASLPHSLAKGGDVAIIRKLLAMGFDFNAEDKNGMRPIHHAISSGHEKVVGLFLDTKSIDLGPDREGKPLLHYASSLGRTEIMRLFLKGRAKEAIVPDGKGKTPVHYAAKSRFPGAVELLTDFNFDVNVKDAKGRGPLHYCTTMGENAQNTKWVNEVVMKLVNNGAVVNAQDEDGSTPLHGLVRASNLFQDDVPLIRDAISTLIKNGADASIKDKSGTASLELSKIEGVRELLQKGSPQASVLTTVMKPHELKVKEDEKLTCKKPTTAPEENPRKFDLLEFLKKYKWPIASAGTFVGAVAIGMISYRVWHWWKIRKSVMKKVQELRSACDQAKTEKEYNCSKEKILDGICVAIRKKIERKAWLFEQAKFGTNIDPAQISILNFM
jgi:ankyrin repeat protein